MGRLRHPLGLQAPTAPVGTGFWIAGSTLIVAYRTEVAFYPYGEKQ